jgi:TonB family protein
LRVGTVIISTVIHVGLAASLITVAERKGLGKKTITVAVSRDENKKKKEDKPPPPKPIAKPAAPKPAAPAKAEAPSAPVRAAPVATNLAMSNADLDVGPGIGLQGRAKAAPAAAPVKVASNISERRTNRAKEELGAAGGDDQPCTEDPTRPVPTVQTEINYSIYPQAQADGIEGKFKARLTIDTNGEVSSVDVVTSIDPGFDAAIVAALKRWRFKPAMACGKPVASSMPFSARFELGD